MSLEANLNTPSLDQWSSLFALADVNQDGIVSSDEWLNLRESQLNLNRHHEETHPTDGEGEHGDEDHGEETHTEVEVGSGGHDEGTVTQDQGEGASGGNGDETHTEGEGGSEGHDEGTHTEGEGGSGGHDEGGHDEGTHTEAEGEGDGTHGTDGTHGETDSESHQEAHKKESDLKIDTSFFVFFCLITGQFWKQFANWTGVPYTSVITVFGVFIGIFSHDLHPRLFDAINVWSDIDPHLLLFIFLPALIFESAFNSDWHIFKKIFWQVIIMAGPILLGATFLSGIMMYYILGYNEENSPADGKDGLNVFTFKAALLYGAIISATDPVAVVALLKELGAPKQLSTLIEGESLLNDGTAVVVFYVLLAMVENKEGAEDPGLIAIEFIQLSGGGPIFGIIVGFIVSFLLGKIYNNYVLEVNTTIVACYIMFYLAEFTILHFSGILALVAFGLSMAYNGKYKISPESEHALHHVWGYIGFSAETVIFILSGVLIGQKIFIDQLWAEEPNIGFADFGKLILAFIMLTFIRFFMLLLFWPCLKRMGYGMTFNQVILASYAGLRGAVGISLALIVAVSNRVPEYVRDVILLHVTGIAFLTLVINATTTGKLVRYLGLSPYSDLRKNMLLGLSKEIDIETERWIKRLRGEKHFKNVDWQVIKRTTKMTQVQKQFQEYEVLQLKEDSLSDKLILERNMSEGGQKLVRSYSSTEREGLLENAKEKEGNGKTTENEVNVTIRQKYLQILKSIYTHSFENGDITGEAVVALIESADYALDRVDQPLCDWEYIDKLANNLDNSTGFMNGVRRFFEQFPIIGPIIYRGAFQRIQFIYDCMVTFVDAHEQASKSIKHTIPERKYLINILNEGDISRKKAEDFQKTCIEEIYPEITRAIQSRRAQFNILGQQLHQIQRMVVHGEIEEKDAGLLNEEINNKIYYMIQNPPMVSLDFQPGRIIYYSELSKIFTSKTLTELSDGATFKERIYSPQMEIISQRKPEFQNTLMFVSRGKVVEKNGDYQAEIPERVYQQGDILNLNLLNQSEANTESTFYCHQGSQARLVPIRPDNLRSVIEANEKEHLANYWKLWSSRILILQNQEFDQYMNLSQKAIKLIVIMAEFKYYEPEEAINMNTGGIVWKGSIEGKESYKGTGFQIIQPEWKESDFMYHNKTKAGVVVMHYPKTSIVDFKASRIIEQAVHKLFKQHELDRFRDNCKKAFRYRVDLWMTKKDHGEEELLRKKALIGGDSSNSYVDVPESLHIKSISLSKIIVCSIIFVLSLLGILAYTGIIGDGHEIEAMKAEALRNKQSHGYDSAESDSADTVHSIDHLQVLREAKIDLNQFTK